MYKITIMSKVNIYDIIAISYIKNLPRFTTEQEVLY